MMRGYWYYSVITTGAAILYVISGVEWLLLLAFLWLLWLVMTKKFPLLPFIISLSSLCFFSTYIPKIPQETSDNQIVNQPSSVSAEINGAIEITENLLQFHLIDSSNQNYLVIYFLDEQEKPSSILHHHNILHGASCTINQTPELPSKKTNPAQFDYQQFLLQRNIQYQVVIDELSQINCSGSKPLANLYDFRQGLVDHMTDTWSEFTASWLNAIVFGDDSMMDEHTEELFQRWSLSHIIAISGSNITLIVAIAYLLLVKGNLLTKEKAQSFLVGFLPIYGVLAGGEPSVWRAVWMVTLFLILQKTRKKLLYTDIFGFVK